MGIKWFDFIRPKTGKTRLEEVDICAEIQQCAQEFRVRELCFNICVNMIANAISRCEVRTFRNRKEIREKEYYLWNVEPNINQNITFEVPESLTTEPITIRFYHSMGAQLQEILNDTIAEFNKIRSLAV